MEPVAVSRWSTSERARGAPGWSSVIVVGGVVALTLAAFVGARSLERRDVRRENGHRAAIAATQVSGSVQRALGYVDTLRRFFASQTDVTNAEFSNFASNTLGSVALTDAAWIERVPARQRARYERRVGRVITDVLAGGAAAGERRVYYPATFATQSSAVVGLGVDLGSLPAVSKALVNASTLFDVTATSPIELPDGQKGLFLVESAPRLSSGGLADGYVVVFLPESWLLIAPGARDVRQVRVGGGVLGSGGRPATAAERSFEAAGLRWTVAILPTKATGAEAALPWIVLVSGLLLAVLSGLVQRHVARRKRVEQALGAAEVKYRQLVEHLPVATYVVDIEDESVVYVSPQYADLLGHPLQDWLGDRHLYETILHPDDRHVLEATRLAHRRGDVYSGEYRLIARDGRTVWVHDEARVVRDDEGDPLYSQGFILDITAQKEGEERQRRLEDELRQAQKMEAVGRLAGGIAHDFNNLLTAITGYSELLMASPDVDDVVRSDVGAIKDAADRATALTRQLLTFSRRKPMQPRLVDLNQLVAETVPMLGRLIGEDVELDTRLPPGELLVHADPVQLEQVVLNLSVNARDAMPGGGRLTITTAAVVRDPAVQSAVPGGGYALLEVTDVGEGMDEETRSRVFEPFFTTKDVGKGTGLGLSTVYAIVEQAGGHIEVSSAPGEGSSFRVFLPSVSEVPGAPARGDEPALVRADGNGGETILVVEDEARVRELVARVLGGHGYRIIEADSGEHALRLVERGEDDVKLVLTDVVMPGMTGSELARRLGERFPSLPIVFMSGYPGEGGRYGPLPATSLLIEKPFTPAVLLERVTQVLNAERRRATS